MPPFTVLHVCMGNICRSPMAERLLANAVRGRGRVLGLADAADLIHSHSAGTGGWHAGEPMNPPAARQLTTRGAEHARFRARKLRPDQIDGSDLVLTATTDQQEYVRELRPDAAARTFVLGEFARLLPRVDPATLPEVGRTAGTVYARGVALVAAVDAVRAGAPPRPTDDVDDPYGCDDRFFTQVADGIEATMGRLTDALLSAAG